MKQKLFFIIGLAIVLCSCTNNEHLQQEVAETRSDWVIDLRELGNTHNYTLDYTENYLELNPGWTVSSYQNDPTLRAYHGDLTNYLQSIMPFWMACSDLMIEEAMNNVLYIYDQDQDDKVLATDISNVVSPIISNQIGPNLFDKLDSLGVVSDKEVEFLKRLDLLGTSTENKLTTDQEIRTELLQIQKDWEDFYSNQGYVKPSLANVASGVCLSIGLSSCEWWQGWLNRNYKQQRIAPLLAFFLKQDISAAVQSAVISMVWGGNRDWQTVARDALIGGVVGSCFGLLRSRQR